MSTRFRHLSRFKNILIVIVISGTFGCAFTGKQQDIVKGKSEYRRLLELQKQKASVVTEGEILKKIPEITAEEYERLGDNYIRQGDIGTAFIQYDKGLLLDPNLASIRHKMGCLLLSRGMDKEAMKEFEVILKNYPNSALAYEGKGMVFLATGKLDKSKESFRQTISLNSNLWQAHTFLGIIYDRQGQFEDAINEYQKAIAINPNTGTLFHVLGMSYYLRGKYGKSIEALRKALRIEPANRKYYNHLGLALSKLRRYEEAFEAFKMGGDKAGAYNNIGYIYMTEQKYKEAIDAFEKAIKIKPKFYIKAYENLEKAKGILRIQKTKL